MEMMTVYTLVQTSVDMDRGSFPSPFAAGSYLSVQAARQKLAEQIEISKKTLDERYNTEERSDDHWEVCQEGYAASCFFRLEILPSKLEKEEPANA